MIDPPGLSGAGGHRDRRLTTCKRCPQGVYQHQEYQWQSNPVPGYVHTACLPRADDPPPHD